MPFHKDGPLEGFLKCPVRALSGSSTAEGTDYFGPASSWTVGLHHVLGLLGTKPGVLPLGLTCNPAQAWSPAPCLSSHMSSQTVADEVDLGRGVAVVCLEREDCIFRTFLCCGFCSRQT